MYVRQIRASFVGGDKEGERNRYRVTYSPRNGLLNTSEVVYGWPDGTPRTRGAPERVSKANLANSGRCISFPGIDEINRVPDKTSCRVPLH